MSACGSELPRSTTRTRRTAQSASTSGPLPLEDDRNAIAHELWRLTYEEYRKASKAYLKVKTDTQVQAQEEDTSPDFSQEKPPTHADYKESLRARPAGAGKIGPAIFRGLPQVSVHLFVGGGDQRRKKRGFTFVSTEGNHVVAPSAFIRVAIQAETRANDGMELMRVETFQAESLDHLPAEVRNYSPAWKRWRPI